MSLLRTASTTLFVIATVFSSQSPRSPAVETAATEVTKSASADWATARQGGLRDACCRDFSRQASPDVKPFGLPFADPPGPSTWLLVQPYGNTTGAYRQRNTTYAAGQGVHFGIDFSAACGTPVVAIGDGVVSKVDALSHGAAPHNLMIDHSNGYASFYGHLLERPRLSVGQEVKRGEAVALTGDPDLTCTSRPHLHLEIRDNVEYRHLYNPVSFIEVDWDTLALTGSVGRGFERDLDHPRQWQFLDDQPDVSLWQPLLNDYARPWPPDWGGR